MSSFFKDTSSQARRTSLTSRKKNAPLSKKVHCEGPQSTRNFKAGSTAKGVDMAPITHLPGSNDMKTWKTSSGSCTGYRTYFDDPKQVRQWVASATGSQPSTDKIYPMVPGSTQGCEASTGLYATGPDFAESPALHSSVSQISVSSYAGISRFHEDDVCTASAGSAVAMAGCPLYPLDSDFNDGDLMRSQPSYDAWSVADNHSFATPAAVDMMYTTSGGMHPNMHGDYSDETGLQPYWTGVQLHEQDDVHGGRFPCSTNTLTWSPASAAAMDPSLSSSYSQSSFLPPHSGSLRSSTTQEDVLSIDLDRTAEEKYRISPLTIGAPMQLASSSEGYDDHTDMTSTLRPAQGFQRAPLSNLAVWPNCEAATYASGAAPYMDAYMQRRPSGEAEISNARRDELYQVGRQEDGLYHCPFEKRDGCTHKPENLKCNYDKHLDSHLKPYRCKVPSCVAVPFSSTACLLRHEREAHGMHGHGEKPYLCSYEDCERSVLGNGFPRRWNLQDHMKRVHDYTGPPSSNGSTSPTPSSASSHFQGKVNLAIRKRRTSSNSQAQALKRTKSTTGTKATSKTSKDLAQPNPHTKQRQAMQKQWDQQHAVFKERAESLDPHDVVGLEQIGANYQALHTISMSIRRLEAGQFASHE